MISCLCDNDALARMFAAQKHLRARLLALRFAQPDAFRIRSLERACAIHDEDEIDPEMLWLVSGQSEPEPAPPMTVAAQDDSAAVGQPRRHRRCA